MFLMCRSFRLLPVAIRIIPSFMNTLSLICAGMSRLLILDDDCMQTYMYQNLGTLEVSGPIFECNKHIFCISRLRDTTYINRTIKYGLAYHTRFAKCGFYSTHCKSEIRRT